MTGPNQSRIGCGSNAKKEIVIVDLVEDVVVSDEEISEEVVEEEVIQLDDEDDDDGTTYVSCGGWRTKFIFRTAQEKEKHDKKFDHHYLVNHEVDNYACLLPCMEGRCMDLTMFLTTDKSVKDIARMIS